MKMAQYLYLMHRSSSNERQGLTRGGTDFCSQGVKEVKTLAGHRGAVTAIFAEENNLYTGAQDGVLRVWDLQVGTAFA
jgi:hypothetical protein